MTRRAPSGEVIVRHRLAVRVTHAVNAVAIFLLIGTGLNIFNAHPRLYWGRAGDVYDAPVFSISATSVRGVVRGITQAGPWRFDTTGVLGWSRSHGAWGGRAWPSWLTVPSFTDLADARHWHFLLAWVLAANALAYLVWSLWSRHLQRDLWPTRADLAAIPREIAAHLRNAHPTGEAARRYNVLQKLAYLGLIALVAGMILTGLTLSPGMDAFAPWLLVVFGGRQSARTLHFVFMSGVSLFVLVHLVEVGLSGPLGQIRAIVTGRWRVPPDPPEPALAQGRG